MIGYLSVVQPTDVQLLLWTKGPAGPCCVLHHRCAIKLAESAMQQGTLNRLDALISCMMHRLHARVHVVVYAPAYDAMLPLPHTMHALAACRAFNCQILNN